MPGSDGSLIFDTKIDDAGFKKGLNGLGDTMNKFGTKLDNIAQNSGLNVLNNQANQLGNTIKGVFAGNVLADMVKAGVGKLADFAKSAIMAASDLQEVQNVVDVTFGESAAAIQEFADSAMKGYGLTEMQTKQYTSTLGAMLKSLGVADKDVLSMSVDLTKLTGDMASFYNLDHDTAYQKIKAGLSGESEPLKALGINLSSATLNAYALQQGLEKTYDKMSEAEKVNLRYMYIMEATADAQGDFSRTSEGFSNQLRILQGNIANLTAGIGEKLLPVATTALQALNGLFDAPPGNPMLDEVNELAEGLRDVSRALNEIEGQYNSSRYGAVETYQQANAQVSGYFGATTDEERVKYAKELLTLYPKLDEYVGKDGLLTIGEKEIREAVKGQRDEAMQNVQLERTVQTEDAAKEAYDTYVQLNDAMNAANDTYDQTKAQIDKVAQAERNINDIALEDEGWWMDDAKMQSMLDNINALVSVYAGENPAETISGLKNAGIDLSQFGGFLNADTGLFDAGGMSVENIYDLATSILGQGETFSQESGTRMEQASEAVTAAAAALEEGKTTLDTAMTELETQIGIYNEANPNAPYVADITPQMIASAQWDAKKAISGSSIAGNGGTSSTGRFTGEMIGAAIDNISSMSIGAGEVIVEQVAESTAESVNAAAPSHGVKPGSLTHAAVAIVGSAEQELTNAINGTPGRPSAHATVGGSHATGLDRVPYDGYLARLHVGESVLNAADASAYRAGRSGGIDYNALGAAVASALPKNTGKTVLAIDGVELAQVQQRHNYDSMSEYDRRVQLGVGKR